MLYITGLNIKFHAYFTEYSYAHEWDNATINMYGGGMRVNRR